MDLFISYSRKDKPFVQRLVAALHESGHTAWVDWKDVPPTENFRREIQRGVVAAQGFVSVLSPDYVVSRECGLEVDHAAEQHKRLIPILCRDTDPHTLPPALADLNWIDFRDVRFDEALGDLIRALGTDLEWTRQHTRLLGLADEWAARRRDPSLALRGRDLEQAEQWLRQAPAQQGLRPAPLHVEYILASRRDTGRRRLTLGAGVALAALLTLFLTGQVWFQSRLDAQARADDFGVRADAALRDRDALWAEVLAARALTLDDVPRNRQRLLTARAEAAPLDWVRAASAGRILLAVSGDGQWVVTVDSHGGRLEVRAALGAAQPQGVATGDRTCAAFAPGGNALAVGEDDGDITLYARRGGVWAARGGAMQQRDPMMRRTDPVTCLAFSPDGRALVSGAQSGTVRVWDAAGGRPRAAFRDDRTRADGDASRRQASCVAVSRDGLVAVGSRGDNSVRLWDEAGRLRLLLGRRDDAPQSVAFSPDGRTLAAGGQDGEVVLTDVRDGLTTGRLQAGVVDALAFSPDGQWLASGSEDRLVRVWDLSSDVNLLTLRGSTDAPAGVAFAPAGDTLVAASRDGGARGWDMRDMGCPQAPGGGPGELTTLRGHAGPVADVGLSAHGQWLATGSWDGTVRLWDVRGRREVGRASAGGQVPGISFARDGSRLAAGDKAGGVTLWAVDPSAPRRQDRLRWTHTWRLGRSVHSVAFRPDGRALACGDDDGRVYFCDPNAPARPPVPAMTGGAQSGGQIGVMAYSPDGQLLATGGGDSTVRLWDAAAHRLLRTMGAGVIQGEVWGVAFSPDGANLTSASEDGKVRTWDTATGALRSTRNLGSVELEDAATSPDGRLLAVAGQDAAVYLWDLGTERRWTLLGSLKAMWAVGFSRDGQWLAAGSQDRTVRVWNVPRLRALLDAPPRLLLAQAERETGLRPDTDTGL